MMRSILFCICSIWLIQGLSGQNSDEDTIKSLNQQWLQAIAKKDSAALGKILAPDFIMVNPAGMTMTRQDNLMSVSAPNIRFSSIHIDSAKVIMTGPETGMIYCWTSFAFTADGKEMSGKNGYLDIYVKRKSRWQAVAAHVSVFSIK
jgi:uncharacterized protein (TIGR02246 family)